MFVGILSLSLVLLVITLLVNLFLIILVRRDHSFTGNIFISLCFLMSLWLILLYVDSSIGPSVLLARLSIFVATVMSLLFFILAKVLPDKELNFKKSNMILIFISTLSVMLLTLSPFVFKNINIVDGKSNIEVGYGIAIFALFTTFFSFFAVYTLIHNFIHGTKKEKSKIKIVLVGLSLTLILITVTILFPILFFHNFNFLFLAPIYVLVFLVSVALAILKYHLFNIKVVATEFLVVVLVLILVIEGMTSGSYLQVIYKLLFALLVFIIGFLLVKSVKKEIQQREALTKLTNNLEKANLRLQELDQQKTEFLSIASHQLRTPLTIIRGYIELIGDGAYGKVNSKMKEILGNMDESNDRLMKLVEEFLDITRIEQGRTRFLFADASLNDTISSVVKELAMKADTKDKKLKVVWKPEKSIDKICMDEEKIRHVVFNFVDNAIKYSDKGIIKVSLKKEDNGFSVRVKDNGFGFDKEDEVNFFQKFYRGKNVEGTNVNGTGLGIYVCRRFIEKHGGHVWAHSPGLGKGSEFGFWIPGIKVDDSESESINENEDRGTGKLERNKS
ncbi:MAG: ATP-binding protein [Candidatus Magasanikbacteria bacterium]